MTTAKKAPAKKAPAKKTAAKKTAAKKATATTAGFSAEERAAMKERAAELKAARGKGAKADDEAGLLAKIAEMPEADRELATEVHRIVRASAPELTCRTWYGMPAWSREGKVVCFFQSGAKFQTRYCTVGFQEAAHLDDGPMWPTTFAVLTMTPEVEARLVALVRRAVG